MAATGRLLENFLLKLESIENLPAGISYINPYKDRNVQAVVKTFCSKYYAGRHKRVLILGINPGRFGGGVTGIAFTDPVALEKNCGIENPFPKVTELSSRFIYRMIEAYGGSKLFYHHFLLSAIFPLALLKGEKNYNYYDTPQLTSSLDDFIEDSLIHHFKMNVRNDVVICLGKKNTLYFEKYNSRLKLCGTVHTLEHPRYIMQYKQKQLDSYINKYVQLLKEFTG